MFNAFLAAFLIGFVVLLIVFSRVRGTSARTRGRHDDGTGLPPYQADGSFLSQDTPSHGGGHHGHHHGGHDTGGLGAGSHHGGHDAGGFSGGGHHG